MIQFLFNVNYRTAFGEDVVLNLKGVRYRMTTLNGELWSVTVSMKDVKVGDLLDYYYSVELDGVDDHSGLRIYHICGGTAVIESPLDDDDLVV